jgi:hypothetical protein
MDFQYIQPYLHEFRYNLPPVRVTWRPPQQYLHYQDLYRGIWDYLRDAPTYENRNHAVLYLHELVDGFTSNNILQHHRILWTKEWLKALDDLDSDCDTVENDN